MALKTITLNEDHIKLIKAIKFEPFIFDGESRTPSLKDMIIARIKKGKWPKLQDNIGWGIDQYNLFGGSYVMEDVALVLGKWDSFIEGTEESPQGRQYPKEYEDYWWSLYEYIWDNMDYIISLVLFYLDKGGLVPGTYKCNPRVREWTKVD